MARFAICILFISSWLKADLIHMVEYPVMELPITPFSNMASGYQATNPGFRALLFSEAGEFLAGGPLTMDAVMKGYSDDASQGSAYGKLVLKIDLTDSYPGIGSGMMQGNFRGTLTICKSKNIDAEVQDTECENITGNIHPERPFQWIRKPVQFQIKNGGIKITRFEGNTGEGGTSQQLALAIFHPAYGFAAPGKAFKDYQSPLVLDLNHDGKLNLLNVYDEKTAVTFDLNGDGQKIRTGWVKAEDGFLFEDNGSGCVQNGTQLFGEFTHSTNGTAKYENGFLALSKLYGRAGKVVVSKQPKLKIWRDLNQDGSCQKSEVVSAATHIRLISLETNVIENPALDEDNEVRITGKYIGVDGKSHLIGDVWFKQRRNTLTQNN